MVGYDYKTGKPDNQTVYKYISILSTLKVLLQLEDVLVTVYICICSSTQVISVCLIISIKEIFLGIMNFSVIFFIQIILHHDDFGVSSLLGDKGKET